MAECSELSLIAELRRSVDNKKKRRVETSQSHTFFGESVQLKEQPTEQPFSVGQIEQPVRILEQPNQPMGKQRCSEVSRETRETSRDINNMAAPWSHQVFDRLSKNLDSYEKQGDLMNKISDRVNQLTTQVAKFTRKRPLLLERTATNTKKQRVQLPLVPNFDGDDFSASDDDDIQQQNNQSKSLDAILDSSEEE